MLDACRGEKNCRGYSRSLSLQRNCTPFMGDETLNNEEAHYGFLIFLKLKKMIKKVENCGFIDQFNCTAFPTPISVSLRRMIELFGAPVKEYFCLMAEFEDGEDEGFIFAVVMPANKDCSAWNVQAHTRQHSKMLAEYINSVK